MRGSGSSDGGGLSDFIDGLGPGQLVGRQLLGAPTLGDVQLSMCYQKGFLEVRIARNLPIFNYNTVQYGGDS